MAIILIGCDDNETRHLDNTPPAPPTGVSIVAGDNRVDIAWNNNGERDLAGYNVYYSYDDKKYELIGSTENNYYIDYGAKNGDVYYYAVVAYDYNGNESDLSKGELAAPRPEGFNKIIYDYLTYPESAGFSFAQHSVVPYDSKYSDFYFENYQGTFYLDVLKDTDIIDMGPTKDIYDISIAPESGWSATKDVFAVVGHTYVIWTVDNHFAKVRISNITNKRVTFDWAYQTIEGEPLMKGNLHHGSYETRTEFDKNVMQNRKH
jgi:hypothetical protein